MYGAVQSGRAWYKTISKCLVNSCNFIKSMSDPCLFIKKNGKGEIIVLVTLYVDDITCHGKRTDVEQVKKDIMERHKIADLGIIKKHLGVWYEWKEDKDGPYVEKSMKDFLHEMINSYTKATGTTPKVEATPGVGGSGRLNQMNQTSMDVKMLKMILVESKCENVSKISTSKNEHVANKERF